MPRLFSTLPLPVALGCALLCGCGTDPDPNPPVPWTWQMVFENDDLPTRAKIPGALLSVWGSAADNVWMVGGVALADGATPTVKPTILNWNGQGWKQLQLPASILGTLMWVTAGADNALWMSGMDGLVLYFNPTRDADHPSGSIARYAVPTFENPDRSQLWGILAFDNKDVWTVGGTVARCDGKAACGVIWHYDGHGWSRPVGLPAGWETTTWFKVFGRGPKDVFVCGLNGHVLHWDGATWQDDAINAGNGQLFTGSCSGKLCVAVGYGGGGHGTVVEHDGSKWRKVAGDFDVLNGVWVGPDGSAVAVGYSIWRRSPDGAWRQDGDAPLSGGAFHGVFVDPLGGIWAVGGDLTGYKTSQLAHFGDKALPKPAPAGP